MKKRCKLKYVNIQHSTLLFLKILFVGAWLADVVQIPRSNSEGGCPPIHIFIGFPQVKKNFMFGIILCMLIISFIHQASCCLISLMTREHFRCLCCSSFHSFFHSSAPSYICLSAFSLCPLTRNSLNICSLTKCVLLLLTYASTPMCSCPLCVLWLGKCEILCRYLMTQSVVNRLNGGGNSDKG